MTEQGRNFLKCAFASPDFAMTGSDGIPDEFSGQTILKDDVTAKSVSFTANKVTYVLFAPTPGVQYWTCEKDIGLSPDGSDAWVPTYTADVATMFPTSCETCNVTQFRYAGLAGEIIPTSSLVNTSGGIIVQKLKLAISDSAQDTVPTQSPHARTLTIDGLDNAGKYTNNAFAPFAFIDGAYSVSTCNEPAFDFQAITRDYDRMPLAGVNVNHSYLNGRFMGLGEMDSICMAVTVPLGSTAVATVRSWHCLEYRVLSSSVLAPFARMSPKHDPVAMAAYREIATQLPIAVTRKENASFWEWVKGALSAAFSLAASAPNPVAKAVGVLGTAGLGLFG